VNRGRNTVCDLPLFMQSIPTRMDFAAYDEAHPEVWLAFEEAALRLIDKGVHHYGAKAIMEYIRYHTALTTGDDFFKVNNSFTAGYARKFIEKHPEHKDFFELREHKA
jgi:hypothetical protein